MTDHVDRLNKLLARLSDANEAEAQAALGRLRNYCRRHNLKLHEFKLVQGDGHALLDHYVALFESLRQKDPRLTELEKANRQLRQELDKLRRQRPVRRRRRSVQSRSDQQEARHV